MSWAAGRETSKGEDIAYCLMGIFNVHLYMMYGEGKRRAFLRLQEEIVKRTTDQSIFLWITPGGLRGNLEERHGLLADDPDCFKYPNNYSPWPPMSDDGTACPTGGGLRATFRLFRKPDSTTVAVLSCAITQGPRQPQFAIYLTCLGGQEFARTRCGELALVRYSEGRPEEVLINHHHDDPDRKSHWLYRLHSLSCASHSRDLSSSHLVKNIEPDCTDPRGVGFLQFLYRQGCVPAWSDVPVVYSQTRAGGLVVALLVAQAPGNKSFILMLGKGRNFDPCFDACEGDDLPVFDQLKERFHQKLLGTRVELVHHSVRVTARLRYIQFSGLYDPEFAGIHYTPTISIDVEITPVTGTERGTQMASRPTPTRAAGDLAREPSPYLVTPLSRLGRRPAEIECPYCARVVPTKVVREQAFTVHRCSACGRQLTYKPDGGPVTVMAETEPEPELVP